MLCCTTSCLVITYWYSPSSFCRTTFCAYFCFDFDFDISMLKPGYDYIFQAYSDWNSYTLSVCKYNRPPQPPPPSRQPTLICPFNFKFVWCPPNLIFSPFKLFEYYSNFFLTEYEYIRLEILNRIRIRIYSVWKFRPNTNTNNIRFLKSTE